MDNENTGKFNVDEAMKELEKINGKLAEDDIALEDALKLYKEGVKLASLCQASLEGVRRELEIINDEAGDKKEN